VTEVDRLLSAIDGVVIVKGNRTGRGDGYIHAVMVNHLVVLEVGSEIPKINMGKHGFHYFHE